MNVKNVLRKSIAIALLLTILIVPALSPANHAHAYNVDFSWRPNHLDVGFGISAGVITKFGSTFANCITTWNNNTKLEVWTTSSPWITDTMVYYSSSRTGNYGVAHDGGASITLYADMDDLTTTQKRETLVHEAGHCLGMDHTQPSNNNIAVMREIGFNNKAYPLSDDIAGINFLYLFVN